MDKNKLPKIPQQRRRQFHLEVPPELWERMVNEAGLSWGKTTKFILRAIEEKLDRDGALAHQGKE